MLGSDGDSRDRPRPPGSRPGGTIEIQAFLGAGVLVAALLMPHVRALPVGEGIVLAGVLRWGWLRISR